MNLIFNFIASTFVSSPITGDGFRPWIAAVILIVSVIVLVAMFVISRRSDTDKDSGSEDSFQDEDE